MIIERIVFNVLAITLFFIIFFKMIQKNDTNYTYVLIAQAVGIAIAFVGLVFRINLPIVVIVLTYVLAVLLPIAIIISEKKGLQLSEIICINIAKSYARKKQYDKAKQILMQMIEKYPNSYYLHKELAAISERTENKEIAIDECIRASEINPTDYNLKIKTAGLLKNTDRTEDAIRVLRELLEDHPESLEATTLLGDIYYEQENYKEAINIYMQAMNYNPYSFEIYYNLGMLYTAINDFNSAKEYYENAAKINSLLYCAKFNLAQISLLYNELDEAEEYLNECIVDDEIADEAFYYLAYISMMKGNKEDAIQYLNTAVEDNEELYEKASRELVFKLIMNQINKPTNTAKERRKLSVKERITIKHLEETCALVGNLNQNDIKAIREIRKREEKEREL